MVKMDIREEQDGHLQKAASITEVSVLGSHPAATLDLIEQPVDFLDKLQRSVIVLGGRGANSEAQGQEC